MHEDGELDNVLRVFVSLQPMKELKRQGGVYYGERMAEADTIAGHSYTVACLSWLLARMLNRDFADLSIEKVLKLALLHDLRTSRGSGLESNSQSETEDGRAKAARNAHIADGERGDP